MGPAWYLLTEETANLSSAKAFALRQFKWTANCYPVVMTVEIAYFILIFKTQVKTENFSR